MPQVQAKVEMTMKKNLSMNNHDHSAVKPFLRWAGGKSKLVKSLVDFVPASNSYGRYFEPFVGAGALFFHMGPREAVLSDINTDLINCYQQVAKHPEEVWNLLQVHREFNSKEYLSNKLLDSSI